MSTVGSVIVNFSAATAGYFAGSKSVKDDASGLPGVFSGIGGSISGIFAGIGAGLSAGAIVEGLKSAGAEVSNLARDAEKLSVSTEQLSRLRFAAKETGVDAETLSKAMAKLQVETGKAAVEGGETAKAFQRFGLDARKLADESPADEFRDIAAKIETIHNPAERAAAMVALMGKSAVELKPLLEQGASGLDAMSAEADRLGVTVSSVDAQSTLRASQAVQKVQEAITGVAQHIAIELAPIVEAAANKMLQWAETGNHVGQIVSGAITGIEYTVAGLIETWYLLEGAIQFAGGVGVGVFALLTEAIAKTADAGAWLSNHVFGTHIDTSGIDGAADHFVQIAKAMQQEGANTISDAMAGKDAAKVFTYFDQVQDKAKKVSADAVAAHEALGHAFTPPDDAGKNIDKITGAIAELHKQVDTFGLSEGAKKLYDLQHDGADSKQLGEARGLVEQLDKLKSVADAKKKMAEENKRLDEQAKRIIEDGLGPLEKQKAKIAELQQLYASGRLTKEQFLKADIAAHKEKEAQNAKAVTANSDAAFSLINQINNRGRDRSAAEQLAAKELEEAKKQSKSLDEIAKNTSSGSDLQLATIGV